MNPIFSNAWINVFRNYFHKIFENLSKTKNFTSVSFRCYGQHSNYFYKGKNGIFPAILHVMLCRIYFTSEFTFLEIKRKNLGNRFFLF